MRCFVRLQNPKEKSPWYSRLKLIAADRQDATIWSRSSSHPFEKKLCKSNIIHAGRAGLATFLTLWHVITPQRYKGFFVWHPEIRKLCAPRSKNGFSTPHLALIRQTAIFWPYNSVRLSRQLPHVLSSAYHGHSDYSIVILCAVTFIIVLGLDYFPREQNYLNILESELFSNIRYCFCL